LGSSFIAGFGLRVSGFFDFLKHNIIVFFNIHLLSPLSRSVALREDIGLIRATIQMYYFFDVTGGHCDPDSNREKQSLECF
jgi:hypothetical protein